MYTYTEYQNYVYVYIYRISESGNANDVNHYAYVMFDKMQCSDELSYKNIYIYMHIYIYVF